MKSLTNSELIRSADRAVQNERDAISNVLKHLCEIEDRKLYLEDGCNSLFKYCVKRWGYSEGAAQRRIQAMRLMKNLSTPEDIEGKLESGKLNLTHLITAQSLFREQRFSDAEKQEILKSIEGVSTREAQKTVAKMSTRPLPQKEVLKVGAEASRLTLTLDQETLDLLDKFKELTAHQSPRGDSAHALKIALKTAIRKLDLKKQKITRRLTSAGARLAGKNLKRTLLQNGSGHCNYPGCTSQFGLETDHIVAHSKGGKTELGNLQLLCRAHHRHKTELEFGMHRRH